MSLSVLWSCGPEGGWGVVLWGDPSLGVASSAVVPIHVKSKITKTYVVGRTDGKGNAELPLWRIKAFESRGEADRFASSLAPLAAIAARAEKDGLLVREKADNVSKQVYRLRKNQVVKLLLKVEGAKVTTGAETLSGDWYRAITDDGILGFVFSHNLALFDVMKGDPGAPVQEIRDSSIDIVFSKTWRPDYFQTMMDEGRIDLETFSFKFGLFADATKTQIRFETPDESKVFEYDSITKIKPNLFRFDDTGLEIEIKREDIIDASFPGPDGATDRVTVSFVELKVDLQDVIRQEQNRRQSILDQLVAAGSRFTSESAGTLSISRSRRFAWSGYDILTPDMIPAGVAETGSVAFDAFFAPDFVPEGYSGVISFFFDGMLPGESVKFLYAADGDVLTLEYLPRDCIEGPNAMRRGVNVPVVAFARKAD